MNKFTLINRINFKNFYLERFKYNMPLVEEIKIKLGNVELEINLKDIKISEDSEIEYKYYFEGNKLIEIISILEEDYLNKLKLPLYLTSTINSEADKQFFIKEIINILPFYHCGELLYNIETNTEYDDEKMLFQYLHQYFYNEYDVGFDRGIITLFNPNEESLSLWLLDDGYYIITEQTINVYEPHSSKIPTDTQKEMISKIAQSLESYKGYYLARDINKELITNNKIKNCLEDKFRIPLSHKCIEILFKIKYQRTINTIISKINNLSLEAVEEELEKYLRFENELEMWFEKWDYNKFLTLITINENY